MRRLSLLACSLMLTVALGWTQQSSSDKTADKASGKTPDQSSSQASEQSAERNSERSREAGESSSHDTRIDTSPPRNDAKEHPNSKSVVEDLEAADNPDASGVQEFHPWSPMKALKDVEVGDYYFRRRNYRAALDRYKEALYYKDNDAIATFRMAQCQEKLGQKEDAKKSYEQYLKILPEGPSAKDAQSSLERLARK